MDIDALLNHNIEFISNHKEALVTSWMAETGMLPSETILVQETVGLAVRFWVEKKYGRLRKQNYPTIKALEAEVSQLRTQLEAINKIIQEGIL